MHQVKPLPWASPGFAPRPLLCVWVGLGTPLDVDDTPDAWEIVSPCVGGRTGPFRGSLARLQKTTSDCPQIYRGQI